MWEVNSADNALSPLANPNTCIPRLDSSLLLTLAPFQSQGGFDRFTANCVRKLTPIRRRLPLGPLAPQASQLLAGRLSERGLLPQGPSAGKGDSCFLRAPLGHKDEP